MGEIRAKKAYSKQEDAEIIKLYESGLRLPESINRRNRQFGICHVARVIEQYEEKKQPEWLRKIISPKSADQMYRESQAKSGSIPYPSKARLMAGR